MQTACVSTRRRAIGQLAVGAGAATAAAVPAIAKAAPDPVLALVARTDALQRQAGAFQAAGDEDASDRFLDLAWAAGDEVMATTPATWEGLYAQLRVLAGRLDYDEEIALLRLRDFAQTLARRASA